MKKNNLKKEVDPAAAPSKVKASVLVRFLRISPRKMRLVIDAVRRKPVLEAEAILTTLNKKGARMTAKALKSAVANAKVKGLDESRLYIADIRANAGPMFKRFMSRSMGRADRILKRTTHLSLAVQEGRKAYSQPVAEAVVAEEKMSKAPAKAKRVTRAKKAAGTKA